MEAKKSCAWANTASLQTELIELQENLPLQEDQCDPVTFWTNIISAPDAPRLQVTVTLHTLTMSASTHSCQSAFSATSLVMNSFHSKHTDENSAYIYI